MARRRHWYNDLARDTRDLNYLSRVYGPKTPEEAARRQALGKKIFIWFCIGAGLLVICFFALLSSSKPAEPVEVTATFEARVRNAVLAPSGPTVTGTITQVPTATIDPALLIRYEEVTYDANGNAHTQCLIKGNISSKGAKIYHLPGSSSYNSTKIDTKAGERWFCTEAEALAAGWHAPGQ